MSSASFDMGASVRKMTGGTGILAWRAPASFGGEPPAVQPQEAAHG